MSHYFHCQEAVESSWIVLPEFSDDYRLASTRQSSSIAVVSSKFNDEAKTAEDIKLLSMSKSRLACLFTSISGNPSDKMWRNYDVFG